MPDAPGPQGVQAGRLEVPVVADLTGFRRKLADGVKAAATGIKAQVDVALSEASLARARAELETGLAGVEAEVHVNVDEDRARNYLRGVLSRVSEGLTAKVRLDADTAVLDDAARRFAVDSDGTIHVGANTTAALTQAEATRRRIDNMHADIETDVDHDRLQAGMQAAGQRVHQEMIGVAQRLREATKEVGLFDQRSKSAFAAGHVVRYAQAVGRFLLVGGILTGLVSVLEGLGSALVGIVGGLSAVVGGLYAITAATGPAIAGLAVLPNLLAAAAQAGATLFAAVSGLGGAVGAILNQRKQALTASIQGSKVEEQNARRVADARRALADASRNGARTIESAERALQRTQEQSRYAQERLNDARRDAKERLEDLNLELRQAAIDEESAAIGVERAKERLADVQANPFASELDRREAELAYQQALQRVDEVAERNDDLAREGGDLRARGVEGARQVVAAKQAIVDAERAEADAARAVADAREQAARSVADAQRNLNDALQESAEGGTAAASAANQVEQALAELSPEARSFAYFLADELIPRFKDLRNEVAARLLPTLETGLRGLLNGRLWQSLRSEMKETADGAATWLGDLFAWLGGDQFNTDFTLISDGNQRALENFGDATLSLLQALTDIMVVVAQEGGLLDRFSEWVASVAAGWEAATGLNRENGKMFRFFDRGADVLALWGDILGNVWEGLLNIGSAGADTGESLLETLRDATADFVQWTDENQGKLTEWFEAIEPVVESVGRILVKITRWFGRIADDPNTAKMVTALEETVGPAIARFLDALQNSEAGEKFADLIVVIADTLTAIVEAGGFQAFLTTLTDILDKFRQFAEDHPGLVEGFSNLAGTIGAFALLAGPLILFSGGLKRLLAPVRGMLGLLDRGAQFLGIGTKGGGKAGKFGRYGLIGALLAALIGQTGIAGEGADGLSSLVLGGLGVYGAGKGLQKLFGGKKPALPGAAGGKAATHLLDQYTLGKGGAAAAPAAAAGRGGLAGRLAQLFRGKGGRVALIGGIAAALGLSTFGQDANANPAGGAPGLLYDPDAGLFVDPNNGLVYDQSGQLLSYPAATPPAGAPPPPAGYDGLGLALGGGALALGGRSLAKGGLAGAGYTPRVSATFTRKAAQGGLRNFIRTAGPKAWKAGAGPIGWGALGVDLLGSAIDSGKADFRGQASSVLKGAGGGAAIGAMVGSVVPIIGTAVGAGVGALIGGVVGWMKRPTAEMQRMKENAIDIGDNIGTWFQDGDQKGVETTAMNVREALLDVGTAAFRTAGKTGDYQAALDAADGAMKDQYRVIRDLLMEAYGLTQEQVEDLIGTYDDYNATEALPKTIDVVDYASSEVGAAREEVRQWNRAKADQKTVEVKDKTRRGLETAGRRLAEYAKKNPPKKKLEVTTNIRETTSDLNRYIRGIPNPIARRTIEVVYAVQARRLQSQADAFLSGNYNRSIYPNYKPPAAAEGLTVNPSRGGTLVRVAEAGRPETIVDEGLQNEMLRKVLALLDQSSPGGAGVYVAEGAIQQTVHNPVPERASVSLSRQMRAAAQFGLEPLTAGAG